MSHSVHRMSKDERSQFKLESYLNQVFIGNILGDVYEKIF